MLLKYCTQYASKFGKLNSSHETGKDQLSFQYQRKGMSKNVQTTIQLHSFHIILIVRLYSKFFKPGFSSSWTKKFQMYMLNLEKAEDPEIRLPIFTGSKKKQGNCWKIATSASLNTLKTFDCVDQNKVWKILKEMIIPNHLTVSWETYRQDKKQQLELDMEQWTGSKSGKEYVQAVYYHPAYLTSMQGTPCEMQAGWNTRWNQDCWEKHQ